MALGVVSQDKRHNVRGGSSRRRGWNRLMDVGQVTGIDLELQSDLWPAACRQRRCRGVPAQISLVVWFSVETFAIDDLTDSSEQVGLSALITTDDRGNVTLDWDFNEWIVVRKVLGDVEDVPRPGHVT